MKTADLIQLVLTENPHMTNEEVAAEIQKRVPGSTTSAASVSSTKSRLKKEGHVFASGPAPSAVFVDPTLPEETDEERSNRIRTRYTTLERMSQRIVSGALPSLIVSGPPGLGKSYTVEQALKASGKEHDVMCGTISAVGLYIALYEQRDGGVVVLDDCDDVFRDETCLNILKAVLDSGETRRVSYRKRATWMDEMDIPASFDFQGSVVFCTNVDFELAIRKGSSMGPHFSALIDRSLYLALTMRTEDDFITRLNHVGIEDGLLENSGLTAEEAQEVMDFVIENKDKFYGLSIRLLMQIAFCFTDDKENWKDDVIATKMRTF